MAGIPTLSQLLNLLSFLGDQPAAVATLITALVLVVIHDWRWSLLALAVQYILAGWLLTGVLEPRIAVLKILVGFMICLVLYITARQVDRGPSPGTEDAETLRIRGWSVPIGLPFRLLIGLLTGIVVLYVTGNGTVALPLLPTHTNLAAVGLMTMGLLGLGLSDEPLMAGMALLTALTGFELFFHSLQQAITVIGVMIGIDFVIVTVVAYLTIAHHWSAEDAERGRLT